MMLLRFAYKIISIWMAPFWVQSLSVILLINIFVFIVKFLLFGLKLYYIIQLAFSIAGLFFSFCILTPHYTGEMSLNEVSQNMIDIQDYYFTLWGIKFASYKSAKSRWTWLLTFWGFVHMLYVSALALITWNCTMYVRITFVIAFIFFSVGYLSLKIQARNNPLIFDNYRFYANSTRWWRCPDYSRNTLWDK